MQRGIKLQRFYGRRTESSDLESTSEDEFLPKSQVVIPPSPLPTSDSEWEDSEGAHFSTSTLNKMSGLDPEVQRDDGIPDDSQIPNTLSDNAPCNPGVDEHFKSDFKSSENSINQTSIRACSGEVQESVNNLKQVKQPESTQTSPSAVASNQPSKEQTEMAVSIQNSSSSHTTRDESLSHIPSNFTPHQSGEIECESPSYPSLLSDKDTHSQCPQADLSKVGPEAQEEELKNPIWSSDDELPLTSFKNKTQPGRKPSNIFSSNPLPNEKLNVSERVKKVEKKVKKTVGNGSNGASSGRDNCGVNPTRKRSSLVLASNEAPVVNTEESTLLSTASSINKKEKIDVEANSKEKEFSKGATQASSKGKKTPKITTDTPPVAPAQKKSRLHSTGEKDNIRRNKKLQTKDKSFGQEKNKPGPDYQKKKQFNVTSTNPLREVKSNVSEKAPKGEKKGKKTASSASDNCGLNPTRNSLALASNKAPAVNTERSSTYSSTASSTKKQDTKKDVQASSKGNQTNKRATDTPPLSPPKKSRLKTTEESENKEKTKILKRKDKYFGLADKENQNGDAANATNSCSHEHDSVSEPPNSSQTLPEKATASENESLSTPRTECAMTQKMQMKTVERKPLSQVQESSFCGTSLSSVENESQLQRLQNCDIVDSSICDLGISSLENMFDSDFSFGEVSDVHTQTQSTDKDPNSLEKSRTEPKTPLTSAVPTTLRPVNRKLSMPSPSPNYRTLNSKRFDVTPSDGSACEKTPNQSQANQELNNASESRANSSAQENSSNRVVRSRIVTSTPQSTGNSEKISSSSRKLRKRAQETKRSAPSDQSSEDEEDDIPLFRLTSRHRKAHKHVNRHYQNDSDPDDPEFEGTLESESSSSRSDDESASDYEQSLPKTKNTGQKVINRRTKPTKSDDDPEPIYDSTDDDISENNFSNSYLWVKKDIEEAELQQLDHEDEAPQTLKYPMEYFSMFFNDDLLAMIVEQTNLNSLQKDGNSMDLTIQEVKCFLAILIYMGITVLPSYADYWAAHTRVSQVADLMPLKRFKKIRSYLHLADNDAQLDQTDRLWKVRPLLDHIKNVCNSLNQLEESFSIDESMVLYKGKKAGKMRQYIPNKPHKWGFKFFNLAGVSGIIYDFFMYCGSDTFENLGLTDEELTHGVGPKAVIVLCKSIKAPRLSTVCFDNFFTSLPLLVYLKKKMNLLSIGTVRSNRLKNPPLLSNKELVKNGRGSYDVVTCDKNEVAVVRWVDNKVVNVASTFVGVGADPLPTVPRWDKASHKKIDVPCPKAVRLYNKCMGGVDKFDHLCELYRTSSRAKRWYLPIVIYMLNLSLVNSWLLYRRDAQLMKLKPMMSKDFRLQVFASLTAPARQRGRPSKEPTAKKLIVNPGRSPLPFDAERRDGIEHWPSWSKTKGRCRNCTGGFTFVKCLKCNIHLCFVPSRNCFHQFHHLPNLSRRKKEVNDAVNHDDTDESVDLLSSGED